MFYDVINAFHTYLNAVQYSLKMKQLVSFLKKIHSHATEP